MLWRFYAILKSNLCIIHNCLKGYYMLLLKFMKHCLATVHALSEQYFLLGKLKKNK